MLFLRRMVLQSMKKCYKFNLNCSIEKTYHHTMIRILSEQKQILASPFLSQPSHFVVNRHKSDSNEVSEEEVEAELEKWKNNDLLLNKISKVTKISLPSMRLDLVLKGGLKISRNKLEKHFYDSNIRLNGKKVMKKSIATNVGDEIDVVKSFNVKNPVNINVARVEILDMKVTNEELIAIIRSYKSLVIENYEQEHTWTPKNDSS